MSGTHSLQRSRHRRGSGGGAVNSVGLEGPYGSRGAASAAAATFTEWETKIKQFEDLLRQQDEALASLQVQQQQEKAYAKDEKPKDAKADCSRAQAFADLMNMPTPPSEPETNGAESDKGANASKKSLLPARAVSASH